MSSPHKDAEQSPQLMASHRGRAARAGSEDRWDYNNDGLLDGASGGVHSARSHMRGSFSPNESIVSGSLDDPHSTRPGSGASMGSGLEGLGLGPVNPPADDDASTSSGQHGGYPQLDGSTQGLSFPGPMPMVSTQLRDHQGSTPLSSSGRGAGRWQEQQQGQQQGPVPWVENQYGSLRQVEPAPPSMLAAGEQLTGQAGPSSNRPMFADSKWAGGPPEPPPPSLSEISSNFSGSGQSLRSLPPRYAEEVPPPVAGLMIGSVYSSARSLMIGPGGALSPVTPHVSQHQQQPQGHQDPHGQPPYMESISSSSSSSSENGLHGGRNASQALQSNPSQGACIQVGGREGRSPRSTLGIMQPPDSVSYGETYGYSYSTAQHLQANSDRSGGSRTESGPIAPLPRSALSYSDSITTASTSSRSLATTTSSHSTAEPSQLQTGPSASYTTMRSWGTHEAQGVYSQGQGGQRVPQQQDPMHQSSNAYIGLHGADRHRSGHSNEAAAAVARAAFAARAAARVASMAAAAAAASASSSNASVEYTGISDAGAGPVQSALGGGAAWDAHHHLRASALNGSTLGVLQDSWGQRQRAAVCRPVRFQTVRNETPGVGEPHTVLLESTLDLGAPHDGAGRSLPDNQALEQLEAGLARLRARHMLEEQQRQLKEMARRREAAAQEEIRRAREVRLQAAMAARIAERKSTTPKGHRSSSPCGEEEQDAHESDCDADSNRSDSDGASGSGQARGLLSADRLGGTSNHGGKPMRLQLTMAGRSSTVRPRRPRGVHVGSPTNANSVAFGIQSMEYGAHMDPKEDPSSIGTKRSRKEDALKVDSGSEEPDRKRGRQA